MSNYLVNCKKFQFKYSSKTELDGRITFWKSSKFELIEYHEIPFDFDQEVYVFSKPKTCLITVLRVLEVEKIALYAIVANVHLSYNKKKGEVKLAQINMILHAVAELKKYYDFKGFKTITFLCGDFNSTPGSTIFELLTIGSFRCKKLNLESISGQCSSQIYFNKFLHPKFSEYMPEVFTRETHYHTIANGFPMKCENNDMAKLTTWYMYVLNPYFHYDFIKKKLKIKIKLTVSRIQKLMKNFRKWTNDQRSKLRMMYCKESDGFEDSHEENKKTEVFSYKISSPLLFKSAYSEVCSAVHKYVSNYSKRKDDIIYQNIKSEKELKEIIGSEFNEIPFKDLKLEKNEGNLNYHTMESPYSHCAECFIKCDYIFFEGKGLTAVKEYEIPSSSLIYELKAMCPNKDMPSDHFPIAAEFRYVF